MVWAQFICITNTLHNLLSTQIFVCSYQNSCIGYKHCIPQQVAGSTGTFASLSRHQRYWKSIRVIVVDQPFLILKRMVQHFTTCGMLDVKEIVHEVHGTINRICAFGKLFEFSLCVGFFSVWCFDQYCIKCVFRANHLAFSPQFFYVWQDHRA